MLEEAPREHNRIGIHDDATRRAKRLAAQFAQTNAHEPDVEHFALDGQKYTIRTRLEVPSGASADTVSVWVVRTGEECPRFVTAYPEGSR